MIMSYIIWMVILHTENKYIAIRTDIDVESRVGSASQFAARLRMTASRPALALEEIEDQLDGITCYDSYIVLGFIAAETLQLAYEEITKVDQFLIITSHEGCNHDGERDAHL